MILGVDNGYRGHICLLDPKTGRHGFKPMPLCVPGLVAKVGHAHEVADVLDYDFKEIQRILKVAKKAGGGKCEVVIEAVLSKPGGTSQVTLKSMMLGQAVWAVSCRTVGLQLLEVYPITWKTQMGLIKKGVKYATPAIRKQVSVDLARELGAKLPQLSADQLHDAAEAFLLARWRADGGRCK